MTEFISYGVLPVFINKDGEKLYLLVQSRGGFWGFPKGTPEYGEEPIETAIRETKEETGIEVSEKNLLQPVSYSYSVPLYNNIRRTKTVVLYPVRMMARNVDIQLEELQDYRWVDFEKAVKLVDLPTIKDALLTVEDSDL